MVKGMTKNKRFTDIEHDYENAWIKCKDNGDFMIYAIYADLDEGLPSLEDLLNGLDGTVKSLTDDYEQLLKENKELKAKNKDLESTNNKQHKTIMRLESEVFNLEQIIKTGKMPVENDEVLILIAKELYYMITHKGSSNLEEIVGFKKRIMELEDLND